MARYKEQYYVDNYYKKGYSKLHTLMRRHPRYKGFILIAEYPGCNRRKGSFEPYTSGDFLKYPDVWKPILHEDVARDEKINKILNED